MADNNTYYRDVIRSLLAHPSPEGTQFLVKGSEHPDAAEAARLKQTSCDVHASLSCARAWYTRLPAQPRLLRGRSRHARIGLRLQRPLRPLLRRHASLRAGVPQQPALPLRARPGAPRASFRQTARRSPLGSPRQRARRCHSALSVAAQSRRVWRLRFHAQQTLDLRLPHIALSAVGRCGHARSGRRHRAEAQSVRAPRRPLHEHK